MSESQTPHLSREQLIAYGQGRLTEAEAAPIEQHLKDCALCTNELAAVKVDPLVTRNPELGKYAPLGSGSGNPEKGDEAAAARQLPRGRNLESEDSYRRT